MSARPPNVLMVLADQHHANLLGCAGHPQVLTPRLDAFAAEGMRFDRAYTQNPICTPSRVSILSGQYCHNHGYYGLGGPAPRGLPSLFHHFSSHGYRTAAYGKLHLPNDPRNWIADVVDEFGDTYETPDGLHARSDFLDGLARDGLRHLEDSWHNAGHYAPCSIPLDATVSDLPYERTQERWCASRALDFITRADDRPFFVQVAFQKPHHPLFPQRRFWDLYGDDLALPPDIDQAPDGRPAHFRARWQDLRNRAWEFAQPGETWTDGARRAWRGTLACISQVDDVFGRLLDGLAAQGLDEHTIVVYGSDHGCYHGILGLPEKAPGICSEAVCRIPLIWRVPGVASGGSRSSHLVEAVDIAPTLAELCHLPALDAADGHSLVPLLRAEDRPLREAAFTEHALSRAVVWDRWRYVHYPRSFPLDEEDVGELYDLVDDPGETTNLYRNPAYREIAAEGRRRLLDWLSETTRVKTVFGMPAEGSDIVGHKTFHVAGDGRAPRRLQPRSYQSFNPDYV